MTLCYRCGDYIIHPQKHLIEKDLQQIPVRSKVFSLLMLFLEHPGEILSKEFLLKTIWDDVQVEEQVVFQTIREVRLLFNTQVVIKNHPRKGYSWIGEVQKIQLDEKPTQSSYFATNQLKWMISSIVFVTALMLILGSVYWFTNRPEASVFKGSVVVLPVKNTIDGGSHDWVYLGAMDQVISQLAANQNVAVMHTDYVLEIMARAQLPRQYDVEHINRIFDVSGANIVVESQLSGSVQEYQLAYKFYFTTHIEHGVIFNKSTTAALTALAQKIAFYTGQSLKVQAQTLKPKFSAHSNAQFNSELLFKALELVNQNNHNGASRLLASLVELEPDNVVGRRLLAQSHIELGQLALAEQVIRQAIGRPESSESSEFARLYFLLGNVQAQFGDLTTAQLTLKKADALARIDNDWLYRAYSAQLLGKIQQNLNHYEAAQQSLEQALAFHQVLQCPLGRSLTWLQMASLFNQQGKAELAAHYTDQAKVLSEQRQLSDVQLIIDNSADTEL